MQRYRLIFDGHIQPQASRENVRQQLANLFQVEPVQIEALFSKPPVVLKEGLTYAEALKDKSDFEATGALCRLEPQSSPAAASAWERLSRSTPQAAGEKTGTGSAERRFGLLHPYGLAFFSRPFYADVIAHWRGVAFVHLLLLLLVSSAVYMVHFHRLVTVLLTQEAPALIDQIPAIDIQDGRVRVNVEEPYTIRRPGDGEVFAIIDTTGDITSLRQTEAMILLTESRLAARMSARDIRVLDLSHIESLQINRENVAQWLQEARKWSPFILFPIALGFSFVLRSIQALFYGGLGLVVASMHQVRLTYSAAVSVAIMAMTPFLLLDALLVLMDLYPPLWSIGGFLITMGYLVFGIRSVAGEK